MGDELRLGARRSHSEGKEILGIGVGVLDSTWGGSLSDMRKLLSSWCDWSASSRRWLQVRCLALGRAVPWKTLLLR